MSPECPQAYRRKCHGWTMPWSWGSVGGCLRSGRARKSAAYRAAVADAAAADGLDVAVTHPNTFQVRENSLSLVVFSRSVPIRRQVWRSIKLAHRFFRGARRVSLDSPIH